MKSLAELAAIREITNIIFLSKDLQEVTYTYTVKYNLLPSAAPNIYKTVGVDYYAILVRPQIDNAIKIKRRYR